MQRGRRGEGGSGGTVAGVRRRGGISVSRSVQVGPIWATAESGDEPPKSLDLVASWALFELD
jgi:hypothetical protein